MAGRKTSRGLRHVRAATGDDRDAERARGFLKQSLAAARSGWRLEKRAARKAIRIVGAAAHTDELFDLVVVRRDILVGDWPRDLPSVRLGPLEIEIGQSKADASPDIRLPAMPPDPIEIERPAIRRQVGLFLRIEKEPRWLFATRRALPRFPRPHMRPEIPALEPVARVQHEHVNALARQVPGGHATGRSAADDNDWIDF
jgi:hypothetical protein